ncbi:hypothetical protein [Sorangium sp. So ce128]|uniref:hypothetical protein n=1 Tax=Sorangium sp. So ce128 TaxID=3133281 RepID=UPI003F5FBF41
MDPRLAKLIEDYRAKVAEAVALLERAGIPRPSSSLEWAQADVGGRGEEQLEHTFEDAKAAGDLVYSGYTLYYTK